MAEKPKPTPPPKPKVVPDRVKATIGVTINAGNYQSIRIDFGMEADVVNDPESDLQSLQKRLIKHLDANIDAIQDATEEILKGNDSSTPRPKQLPKPAWMQGD